MYVLVSGKGRLEKVFGKDDEFEFALKGNKRLHFKGTLGNISEKGMVTIQNLQAWTGKKFENLDGSMKLGVYEFSEYRKVGGSCELANFTIGSSLLKTLVSLKGDVEFPIGSEISCDYSIGADNRFVCSGVLSEITDKNSIVLKDCTLTVYSKSEGNSNKVTSMADRWFVPVKEINKVWYTSNSKAKYSVKVSNRLN